MKSIHGIFVPDEEVYFARAIGRPLVQGKGTFQHKKLRSTLRYVRQRRHAVDIGAHVGLVSRILALSFEKVSAFEPLPAHRECFAENCPDVSLFPYAVGRERGTVSIAPHASNSGMAHVSDTGVESSIAPLDDFALTDVDFIKIDVEGYELDAVIGAEQTIRSCRPVLLVEQKFGERYGHDNMAAVNLLRDWGMREVGPAGNDRIMVWPNAWNGPISAYNCAVSAFSRK